MRNPMVPADDEPSPQTPEPRSLDPLQRAVGYRFTDPELLERALTHRSYSNERGLDGNYERLEFLGDAVLALVTARWLFEGRPKRPEGELAKLKSFLVSAPVLAAFARTLRLGELLRLGVGEDRSGGRKKDSILADVVEAIFGAIYLEGGLEPCRRLIEPMLVQAAKARQRFTHTDPKTTLQELSQGRGWGLPQYRVVEETGPDHQKSFKVECRIGDKVRVAAEGRSKKEGAQRAAAAALDQLGSMSSGFQDGPEADRVGSSPHQES